MEAIQEVLNTIPPKLVDVDINVDDSYGSNLTLQNENEPRTSEDK